jgi:hypothetical protein
MHLTSDNLVKTLVTCANGPADEPAEIVALVHGTQQSFAATLFSAWQAEGAALNVGLLQETDAVRSRVDFYRAVAAQLLAKVDGLTTVKGLEVADLYPAGWVRYMNDIDFVAPDESSLWQAVGLLTGDGWDLDGATFTYADGSLQAVVSLRLPHEDRYQFSYGIEVSTFYTLGDLRGIRPVLRLPAKWRTPGIKNMVMLLNERYEQPFRARDVLDAALLRESLRDGEIATLHEAITELNLAPEYSELAGLVRDAGLGELSSLPGGHVTAARVRARRLARGASFFTRPVTGAARHLQRRMIAGTLGRGQAVAWTALGARLDVASAVQGGLIAFGLPLDGPAPDVTAAVLHHRGKQAWIDTPAGRFLLTIGEEVEEWAVAELSRQPDPEMSQRARDEPVSMEGGAQWTATSGSGASRA